MSDPTPDQAEADDLPKTEQEVAPRPYTGPVDSIADFCRLLKAEFQMIGLNKLVRSARARDQLISKEFVGKHFMCLEACDVIDTKLDLLRKAANAADDDDEDVDLGEPIMGVDEDSEEASYG